MERTISPGTEIKRGFKNPYDGVFDSDGVIKYSARKGVGVSEWNNCLLESVGWSEEVEQRLLALANEK